VPQNRRQRLFYFRTDVLNRNFKGVWIPKDIWLDKNLSIVERCLLAEIDSLSDDEKEKGCFASNRFLSTSFGVSVPTISRGISTLERLGYIVRVNKEGCRRELKLMDPNQNDKTPDQNDKGGNQNDKAILENSLENSLEKDKELSPKSGDLFDLPTKPPEEPEPEKERTPHGKCVDEFFVLHEKRTGKKPMFDGAVGSLLKNLLKNQDAATVIEKLRRYYSDNTLWFAKNGGRSFRSFYQHYNEIDIEKVASDKSKETMKAWGIDE